MYKLECKYEGTVSSYRCEMYLILLLIIALSLINAHSE